MFYLPLFEKGVALFFDTTPFRLMRESLID